MKYIIEKLKKILVMNYNDISLKIDNKFIYQSFNEIKNLKINVASILVYIIILTENFEKIGLIRVLMVLSILKKFKKKMNIN